MEGYSLPSQPDLVLRSAASVFHASPNTACHVAPLIVELPVKDPVARMLIVEDAGGHVKLVPSFVGLKGFALAVHEVISQDQQEPFEFGAALPPLTSGPIP
jgi:hypothetical protein